MSLPAFLVRFLDRFPSPSPRLMRAFAIAAVVTHAGIAVTGSVVRVTGSGLGCPTWPNCFPGSLVPVAHPEYDTLNQWIEFGNRLLTGVVGFVSLACLFLALITRPRRRRLVLLALAMPVGTLAQGVMGGITVLMELRWWTVALHFLGSALLVWLAVLLVRASTEGDQEERPLVPGAVRGLVLTMNIVLAGLLVTGTLVTAAGPHSGDIDTPRLELPVANLAQVHAEFLFLFLGMLIALGFTMRAVSAPARMWRGFWWVVGVVLAQGTVGMVQYWTGVPEVLVALHVLGAGATVVVVAWFWTTLRDRGRAPVPFSASGRATNGSASSQREPVATGSSD
ncbi:COX15/CtaA family protein [Actinoalloteichus spitiensis]|uniref:COX15/CtaA family protein n=1 Tax=Actinoalloteichus spitiensis TaxID=252394 RepID=UPI0003671FD7|nr:COX15/CtaA family protein [Actinoalloteichus spitiensis]